MGICDECIGMGWIEVYEPYEYAGGTVHRLEQATCPICKGTGKNKETEVKKNTAWTDAAKKQPKDNTLVLAQGKRGERESPVIAFYRLGEWYSNTLGTKARLDSVSLWCEIPPVKEPEPEPEPVLEPVLEGESDEIEF